MLSPVSPDKSLMAALRGSLPSVLPGYLQTQRWFGGKARTLRSIEISDVVPFSFENLAACFIFAKVNFTAGPSETYDIPLVAHHVSAASDRHPSSIRLRPEDSTEEIVLSDALANQQFLTFLLQAIADGLSLPGARGAIRAVPTTVLQSLWQPSQGALVPSLMNAEQSNSSVAYGKRLVLKVIRRLENGVNPDLEIGSFLTRSSTFRNVPPLAGSLEYVNDEGAATALGILQGYISNQGDAWQFTLQALAEYYDRGVRLGKLAITELPGAPLLDLSSREIPDEAARRIGPYFDSAALLGRRTAELHLALASAPHDPSFSPQPFSASVRQAVVNSATQLLHENFELLRRLQGGLPDRTRQEADKVLKFEAAARSRFQRFAELETSTMVTRIHGDYHLGQVLVTDNDFVIIDFEGEPARPLEERRQKRSPLQDVAGMLRSFHYAAYASLLQRLNSKKPRTDEDLENWAEYWQKWVSVAFLKAYLHVAENSIFIPARKEDLALMFDLYLLDKAVYELGYELNNRPTWVRIPLDGISQLLKTPSR